MARPNIMNMWCESSAIPKHGRTNEEPCIAKREVLSTNEEPHIVGWAILWRATFNDFLYKKRNLEWSTDNKGWWSLLRLTGVANALRGVVHAGQKCQWVGCWSFSMWASSAFQWEVVHANVSNVDHLAHVSVELIYWRMCLTRVHVCVSFYFICVDVLCAPHCLAIRKMHLWIHI